MSINRYGFPIVTCRRCAGTGSFGPSSIQGGRCFDCGGTGAHVRRGKAAAAWGAFVEAGRAFHRPTGDAIEVGDRIRVAKSDALRTVAAIEWELQIGRSSGASTQGTVGGDRPWVTCSHLSIVITLTFEDGSTSTTSPRHLVASRAGRVDPTPFLEGIR